MAAIKTEKNLLNTDTPLALWGTLLLLVLMSFACYHLYVSIIADPAQERSLALARQGAAQAAQTTNRFLTERQQHIQSLASRSLTAIALTASESDRQKLESSVTELLEGAEYSRLITSADTGNARKLNFVALDLSRRVLAGETVSPEAMLVDRQWHILMVAPINDKEGHVIGCLLTSFPTSYLAGLLAENNVQGQAQLVQTLSGTISRAFITEGNAEPRAPSQQVDTSLPYWKVSFKPSLEQLQASGSELWLFYSVLAVTLLIAIWVVVRLAVQKGMATKKQQDKLKKQLQKEEEALASATSFLSTIPGATTTSKDDENSEDVFDMADEQPDGEGTEPADTESLNIEPLDAEQLPSEVFRAYDIRGIYGSQITEPMATHLGLAIGTLAQQHDQHSLVTAHDGRTSSPGLYQALVDGILASGCNVIALGQAPTPLMNFAINHLDDTSSGIIVTASHNPPEYNGFKIAINGTPLTPEDIAAVRQRILEQDYVSGSGEQSQVDLSEDYIERISEDAVPADELQVVVDASNGATGPIAPKLLEQMGCDVTPLHCEVDGTFPGHPPDTSVAANLEDLIQAVKHQGADLGLAFDGDGDRIVAVSASGRIVWPDELMLIFARDILSRQPGADIVFDVKSTRRLNALIGKYGGRPVLWKTGHSFMREKVRELDAPLGGEYSGHIFFNDRWFGFDDGMYAAARLIEIISLREQSLDDMLDTLPPAESSPEYRVPVADNEKFSLIETLSDSAAFDDCKLITIDGLRVEMGESWGLVRASNTSPQLTLRFEGSNKESLLAIKQRLKSALMDIKPDLTLEF